MTSKPSLVEVLCFDDETVELGSFKIHELSFFLPLLLFSKKLENVDQFHRYQVELVHSCLSLSQREVMDLWVDSKDALTEDMAARSGVVLEESQSASENVGICFDVLNSAPVAEIIENPYFHADVGTILSCALLVNEDIPIGVVVDSLMRMRCREAILSIVRNCCQRIDLIIDTLLQKPNSMTGQILHQIAEHGLWFAMKVRDALSEAQMLPDLVLHLTLHNIRDTMEFCATSLHKECTWLKTHFLEQQEKEGTPAAKVRGYLLHATEFYDIKGNGLSYLLSLYSGLCGMWGLRFSQGSAQRVCNAVLAALKEKRAVGEQVLCFLLVCEGLFKLVSTDVLVSCISSLYDSEVSSLVFLVAVRFATKGLSLNANWAKSSAKLPVSIHGDSLQGMGNVFREIFSEEMLAKKATTMEPVIGLNDNMSSTMQDADVLAMKEMLSSYLLLRTLRNPSGWLAKQLAELELPLHYCVADLINDFVHCSCTPSQFHLAPLTDLEIAELSQSPKLVVRLCVAYLVLTHNSTAKKMGKRSDCTEYSRETIEGLSLKKLLVDAEGEPMLGSLASKVTGLCFLEHPEIMVPETYFEEDDEIVAEWLREKDDSRLSVIYCLPENQLCEAEVRKELFEQILPSLMSIGSSEAQTLFCKIWRRLHSLMPVEVALATLKCFKNETVTCVQLIADPVIILKVNKIVFEIAPFFGILLEILSVYAVASRQRLSSGLANANDAEKEGINRLIVVQDCLISQLVIEVCSKGSKEIQSLSCFFLHQQWMQNPQTLQLLHYQGYMPDAVPVLVQHVPSMHVCIDFLPALVQSDKPSRRIWAVYIASFLLQKYATPRALEISKMIIHSFIEEVSISGSDKSALFESIGSLKRILKAFPVLLDDMIELCQSCASDKQRIWEALEDAFDLPPVSK